MNTFGERKKKGFFMNLVKIISFDVRRYRYVLLVHKSLVGYRGGHSKSDLLFSTYLQFLRVNIMNMLENLETRHVYSKQCLNYSIIW